MRADGDRQYRGVRRPDGGYAAPTQTTSRRKHLSAAIGRSPLAALSVCHQGGPARATGILEDSPREAADANAAAARLQRIDPWVTDDNFHRHITVSDGELGRERAPAGLSRRELDVLRLLAAGESNAQIARRLGLSTNTIERHVANLYRKIDARGRADATAHALRNGLA